MSWAEPRYPRSQVDEAGTNLFRPQQDFWELGRALRVIDNWRSAHAFPLNTFQMTLRRKARQVSGSALVAQRIKRLSSIDEKLRRFKRLRLSEMQDIGGCRVVFNSVQQVDKLVETYKNGDLKHKLDDEDDYISSPKRSGYRGRHLIYRYFSDKKETYNDLKVEIQVRSQLQHAWATAVEAVGAFTQQALKTGQGTRTWRRFFALMGTEIALREKAPPVPGTPSTEVELLRELRDCVRELEVEKHLDAYDAILSTSQQLREHARHARYFLVSNESVSTGERHVTISIYGARQHEQASNEYLALERANRERPSADAVLVSVESIEALRLAYPNYFFDIRTFRREVGQALKRADGVSHRRRPQPEPAS